ncbi:MAG: hypothetical protein ACRBCT_04295 [Alphaproteobacteria bacterium]
MQKSYAHSLAATKIGNTPLNLNKMFGFSTEQGIFTHEKSRIAGQLIEAIETGEFETYDLNPWERSLAREMMILIHEGNYDKVFDLISEGLTIDPEGTLKALSTSLATLTDQGFDYKVSAFTEHLKLSGIMDNISFDPFESFANIFASSPAGFEHSFSSYLPADLYSSELAAFLPASTLNAGMPWWGENNPTTANDPQNQKDTTHVVADLMAKQGYKMNTPAPPAPSPFGRAA